jgi:pimeloyl-ACP methyl ester carboxylesterase
MGRHSAFELAVNCQDQIEGLIIESGRPTLGQFTHGLEDHQASILEAAYQEKVRSIDLPVLVIHGEADTLAPPQDAIRMFQEFPSAQKRLLTIPGAGHNDLLYLGINEYFGAIVGFVCPPSQDYVNTHGGNPSPAL